MSRARSADVLVTCEHLATTEVQESARTIRELTVVTAVTAPDGHMLTWVDSKFIQGSRSGAVMECLPDLVSVRTIVLGCAWRNDHDARTSFKDYRT
jgi:hypothetical protein